MNYKNLFLALITFGTITVSAQSNLLNAKTPDQIGKKSEAQMNSDNDKPLPYGYVDDRDVLFGKTVWEIIDLDERVNFPMYYPIDESLGDNRKSLYSVLVAGIRAGKISEVYDSSYFTTKKSLKDIEASLVKIDTTPGGIDQMNEDYEAYKSGSREIDKQFINVTELKAIDVDGYRVVGRWYFDKRQGELKYRMLGICPIIPDVYTMGQEEKDYIDLFWVFFPSVREVLHENYAFNGVNSSAPISFDHLLNARRFSATIYQEENVQGDRKISEYMKENAQMQLLESERIKEKIRNFEQDMWSY
ncbi:gliding motility protein GldN [uncultured Flavobacterium sp.]|uniref:type IX secretion system ring protein PorN/GldN n=1 Tax=uncultured Flavobacterium sp. TaxID=165435 RepID=UPI0030EF2E1A|tara:strand:- start:46742 stop:47650 length:909 start_codon:yes stop_codon:yes gene_type:complete